MSRRTRRFLNRQIKRQKKKSRLSKYDNFENVLSFSSLYKSAYKASKGVKWKISTQKYMTNILFKIYDTHKKLKNGKDIRKGLIEFTLKERGKTRYIKSIHFSERVVQKSLCNYVLTPIMMNSVIYDNYASQKNKGTSLAIKRLIYFLNKYKQQHNKGFILLIDFKSYFDNIDHSIIKNNITHFLKDEKIIQLCYQFIDIYGDKGLGLGSETSQLNAVLHINYIDHYIKEKLKQKYYGRYVDDSFIIGKNKKEILEIFEELKILYKQFGITINKKSHIADLNKGFIFLKTKFFITKSGKLIIRPCRKNITRSRQKLKKQFILYKNGIIELKDFNQIVKSYFGTLKYKYARKTIFNIKYFIKSLLNKEL